VANATLRLLEAEAFDPLSRIKSLGPPRPSSMLAVRRGSIAIGGAWETMMGY
jgi:hypothetical protein